MSNHPFAVAANSNAVSQAPTGGEYVVDRFFRAFALVAASLLVVLVAYIVWKIGGQALPAIRDYHIDFLTSSTWNVQEKKFGILPGIWGTLYRAPRKIGWAAALCESWA
jgi:phosphate transport system permease protein